MKCPVCDVTLLISSRESIEIDHCPQCRGVWLDRGELDKIIERSAVQPAVPVADRGFREGDRDRGRHRDDDDDYRRRRKKRSFLDDIFDFD